MFANKKNEDQSFLETLARLNIYAEHYGALSIPPKKQLHVVASGQFSLNQKYSESDYPNLHIFVFKNSRYNIVGTAYKLLRIMRERQLNPSILISGDPIYGFYVAKLIKFFSKRQIPVQIQMHGDLIFSRSKERIAFTIKTMVIFLNLHFAESIRLVAPQQKRQLQKFSKKLSKRCFIAPIPVYVPQDDYRQKYFQGLHIGFLGRLHKERGIRNLVDVYKKILISDPKAEVSIAGLGPELTYVKRELLDKDSESRVRYLGFIAGDDKEDFFRDCSLLLSVAPSESFGMTIREAVLRGVPVIALENTGTKVFKESFSDSVHICDDLNEVIRVSLNLDNCTLSSSVVAHNREVQNKSNVEAIDALVQSWISFETN